MSSLYTPDLIFIVGGVSPSYTSNNSPFQVVVVTMVLNPAARSACYRAGSFLFVGTYIEVPSFSEVPFRELFSIYEVIIRELPTSKTVPSSRSWCCNKKGAYNLSYKDYKEGSII